MLHDKKIPRALETRGVVLHFILTYSEIRFRKQIHRRMVILVIRRVYTA